MGHCSVPAVGQRRSALALANNCCIRKTFGKLVKRFERLYKSKAYVHHYTEYMDEAMFGDSINTVCNTTGMLPQDEGNGASSNLHNLAR